MTDTVPAPSTVVSPDVVEHAQRVILVPMDEWKQCAQRGVRSCIQAFMFLMGGGSVVSALERAGVAESFVASLPTFKDPLLDAIVYSFVFGVLVFVWNFIEFWLDIDMNFPRWRA